MIVIHAKFQIHTDKEQSFLDVIRPLVTASRAEEGNISYDLMKDTEHDGIYTMVEVWEDMSVVESHNKSEHFTSFGSIAPEYLAAPMKVNVYDGKRLK
ncbi:putative quinol monooxygenase [Falsibacillus albus]|uniref:Antibiotic biosynthesis monooxygenase n=1 Tax=Falsibacillus albus TaxID=2478915 RepID=A0A3L7K2W5_9BACI|nr:putative quinol monooxygenase [Falsibacillus albus]RLQ97447.1 antibiotic biosynthesis monooxygenase [Falsibacillus albus]